MADEKDPQPVVSSEAALNDRIATNRTLPIPNEDNIPAMPDGYKPTDGTFRVKVLRKVDETQEAELRNALLECAALDLAKELGPAAPTKEKGTQLSDEVLRLDNSLHKAEALVQYLKERKSILLNDSVIYLEQVRDELDHFEKSKPQLSSKFRNTRVFFNARSQSISQGISEAKKKKKVEKKPPQG
jgi:hypothetical protein